MTYTIADPNKILITDCSSYDGVIDYNRMISSGAKGVILKAGQNCWTDSKFEVNKQGAINSRFPFGSYYFWDSRSTPKNQAKHWISLLNGNYGKLKLNADYEERYGGLYGGWRYFYDFLEEVKLLVPKDTVINIYTNFYYWLEFSPNPATQYQALEYFKQYPLWIAAYGTSVPLIPKPFDTYIVHQFTDSLDGKLYGVDCLELDGSYFYGNLDDWNNCTGDTITSVTPIYPQVNSCTINTKNGLYKEYYK